MSYDIKNLTLVEFDQWLRELKTWRREVQDEKDRGHVVSEFDTKAILTHLDDMVQFVEQVGRVRKLEQDLRNEAASGLGPGIVARAFADEIDRALRGAR